MYSLVKPLSIREELLNRKIRIFTNQEFTRLFKLSPYQAEYFLRQLSKEGLLARLKKGFYILKTDPPIEEEIANALYKPSYVSFEYALAYYSLIPEIVYLMTSATTKPTRLFETEHLAYGYYTIKTESYTGYILARREERRFLIAEPEKAVVDYLYFVALGRKSLNDRLKVNSLDKNKVLGFARLYNRVKLDQLIKELL